MSLVAIQCKNCGAALQEDPGAGYICPHCHTSYAMEQTINQTFQTTNIANATIIDDGSGTANQEVKSAEANLTFRDYWYARKRFEELSERYAHMYQVWWGLARAITEDFTAELTGRSDFERMSEALDHALALAPADEKKKIRMTSQAYHIRWETYCNKLCEERNHQLDQIEERREQQISPIERRIDQLKASKTHRECGIKRVETIGRIVPIAGFTVVFVFLLVISFGSNDDLFNLILCGVFSVLFSGVVIYLPLKIVAFLIVRTIGVSAGMAIGRYDREIKRLDEKGARILESLTEEIRTVREQTIWLGL